MKRSHGVLRQFGRTGQLRRQGFCLSWLLVCLMFVGFVGIGVAFHSASAAETAWRGRCLSVGHGTDEDVVYATSKDGLRQSCTAIARDAVVYDPTEVHCAIGLPGCACVGHLLRAPGGVTTKILPGDKLTMCNGRTFTLQNDGNLVLYGADGTPIWTTGTFGRDVASLAMQGDGNLVLYDSKGAMIWATGTSGHAGAYLAIQEDGNVVLYDQGQHDLWTTNTQIK